MRECSYSEAVLIFGQGGPGIWFDSGVTNGVRDDGGQLGAGCGSSSNDHWVPDVAFGIDITDACVKHDKDYSTCGVSKAQAEKIFPLTFRKVVQIREEIHYYVDPSRMCIAVP
jgi:hypothetical protein